MTNTDMTTNLPNDTRFEDLIKQAGKLGTLSVVSATAKPNLAIDLVRGIADGVLDTDDKIDQHFDAYLASRSKATAKNTLTQGLKEDNENSIKANRSKQRQLAEAAKLPAVDFVEVLQQVTDVRAELIAGETKVKPAYDAMVDVARAQLKQPLEQLDVETIGKLVAKAEAKEKDILAKLADEYKRTYKLAEKMAEDMLDTTHIEAARDAIADAITALDGEVPAMSKQAKEDEEAIGFLMRKGYTKAQARGIIAKQ